MRVNNLEERIEELKKLSRKELIERASKIQFIHSRKNYRDWNNAEIIRFVAMIEDSFEKAFSGDYPEEHEGI